MAQPLKHRQSDSGSTRKHANFKQRLFSTELKSETDETNSYSDSLPNFIDTSKNKQPPVISSSYPYTVILAIFGVNENNTTQ